MHLLISKKIVIYLLMFCFLVSINNISLMNVSFPKISKVEINGLNVDERKKIENIIFFTWDFFIFHFATLSFDWHLNCDFLTKPEVADFIEAI